MCAVSMIYDYYRQPTLPVPQPVPWPVHVPVTLPWTPDAFADLKEILKRLDALDKKLGLEHCEDPKKAEWMAEIEERLKRLEATRA
jgi:hypothetical protein